MGEIALSEHSLARGAYLKQQKQQEEQEEQQLVAVFAAGENNWQIVGEKREDVKMRSKKIVSLPPSLPPSFVVGSFLPR